MRDSGVLVEIRLQFGPYIMTRVINLGVRGVEADRKAKGLIGVIALFQVFDRTVTRDIRQVPCAAIGLTDLITLVSPVLIVVEMIEHFVECVAVLE